MLNKSQFTNRYFFDIFNRLKIALKIIKRNFLGSFFFIFWYIVSGWHCCKLLGVFDVFKKHI